MAKPITDSPKNKIITFRIDEETAVKLDRKVGDNTISEYVRNIIEKELAA